MLEFIIERRLGVGPYFSKSVLHVLFVLLGWFLRWKVSGRTDAVLRDIATRISSCTT